MKKNKLKSLRWHYPDQVQRVVPKHPELSAVVAPLKLERLCHSIGNRVNLDFSSRERGGPDGMRAGNLLCGTMAAFLTGVYL